MKRFHDVHWQAIWLCSLIAIAAIAAAVLSTWVPG
jgi:hypothetical protein